MISKIIKWHDEGNVFNAELVALAKNINEAFTHIAINAALDRVINRRNAPFHLKKDIEKPF